jgi:hypothetical protein
MTAPSVPFVRRHARLGRYAFWQFYDFGLNVGILSVLIFALLGVSFLMSLHAHETFLESQRRPMALGQKLGYFKQLVEMFTSVAPMIAMSGIVSTDRSSGYTRFLFSKPLSPTRYYGQTVAVKWIGYLVVAHVLMWWYSFFAPVPEYSWKAVVAFSCLFISVGGILFLLSVVTRVDGAVAILFLLCSAIAWDRWEQTTGFKHALLYLLPPINNGSAIQEWFIGINGAGTVMDIPFPAKWFWWLTGYGLACLVAGLVILRRAPLTKA